MNERRFSGEIERLRSPERLARLEVERVLALSLDGLNAKSVLDVGTGSGVFAEAFAARGLAVAGADLRDDMLEAARQYVPSGDFRLAPMESLPFADDSVTLVFLGFVLHEADDVTQALREARRVAISRVIVQEWPYQVQEFGPPLDHRLPQERIIAAAQSAGFARYTPHALNVTSLYILDK
jgi:ubiquinone/menaquinone biosynthesis C-methylase UbiE